MRADGAALKASQDLSAGPNCTKALILMHRGTLARASLLARTLYAHVTRATAALYVNSEGGTFRPAHRPSNDHHDRERQGQ